MNSRLALRGQVDPAHAHAKTAKLDNTLPCRFREEHAVFGSLHLPHAPPSEECDRSSFPI